MRMRLNTFQGELPRLYKTLLPEGAAQIALDTNHERGTIKALHDDLSLHSAGAAPVDFYLHNGTTWLTFNEEVDVVPGPVADDRLYITRANSPPIVKVMSDGGTEYPLALPAPSLPLTVTANQPVDEQPSGAQRPYDENLSTKDFITAVYNDVLNYEPDLAGLNFWADKLDNTGLTREQFILEQERVAAYARGERQYSESLSTTDFITAVYNDILGRQPDPDGYTFWQQELDSGDVTRAEFILETERNLLDDIERRPTAEVLFVYTWVSILDEESFPSPPSAPTEIFSGRFSGGAVELSFPEQPPSSSRIDRVRLYRSQTTELGATEFFFVKELLPTTSAYPTDLSKDPLQELLGSAQFDPPVDGLQGITEMQSGMLAAFEGKSLYFCEPYKPHAWPLRYELVSDNPIVGLVSFGSMLAVLTTGEPYVVQGTAPENLIMEKIEQNAPCVSKDGIVDLGYAAAYPSTDGLITLSQSGGAQNITRGLFERDQWREFRPETFSAGSRDGAYVFSFDPGDGGGRQTAMIALSAEQPSYIRTSNGADKFRFDVYTGNLHYIDGSAIVREFASSEAGYLSADWQSSQFHLPTLTSFGAILIEGDELETPAEFEATVFRDGQPHTTITILNEPARIAAGLGRRWSIRVKGKVEISRITLAGDVQEIWT